MKKKKRREKEKTIRLTGIPSWKVRTFWWPICESYPYGRWGVYLTRESDGESVFAFGDTLQEASENAARKAVNAPPET